jgi:hypothetical protein
MTAELERASGGLTGQLARTSGELASHLARTSAQVTSELEQTSGELTSQLAGTTARMTAQLERTSSELTGQFEQTSGEMTARLEHVSDDVTGRLERSSGALGERLDRLSGQVTVQFDRASGDLSERLERAAARMTSQLEGTSTRLFEHVEQANSLMADRLDITAAEVAERLDGAGKTMFSHIDGTARDLGQRFDVATELLEKITADISGRMEGVSDQFTKTLEFAGGRIVADLGKASTVLSDGLGQTSLQITGQLEQQTSHMATRFGQASRDLEQTAAAASRRLEDAGAKFAHHLETANSFLAEQLSSAANTIDDRLGGVSLDLTGKLETTGSRIFERLEDVSELVQRSLERFNGDMERVLTNREEALNHLVAALGKKAQDVDVMMRNYVSLMEESLTSAEARSAEIGRLIGQQTTAAATNLEKELTRLESSSAAQVSSAAKVMRDQHERALSAMNDMMAGTAKDFQQTAQDMRLTAHQVVKDIESARNELKRAILELPDETRTNADAMRRVVIDQITALNALADVVKRQTGGFDISGPGLHAPPMRETGSGKSEGAASPAPLNRTFGAQEMKPRERSISASQAVPLSVLQTAPVPRPSTKPDEDIAFRVPHLAAPAAVAVAKAPPAPPVQRDLSRETETLMQKLNGAARDLVEAVDGMLPAELERRYGAGESHVYTHRLFEERGPMMRRSIRKRYYEEKVLRGRVDGYVRLFERLLDTVSGTAQGTQLTDACLASESGKLYVMLANASGRIRSE